VHLSVISFEIEFCEATLQNCCVIASSDAIRALSLRAELTIRSNLSIVSPVCPEKSCAMTAPVQYNPTCRVASRHDARRGDNGEVNPTFRGRILFGAFILVFALVSLWAALTLSTEGFYLLKDGTPPSCNINPFFSCGNVMQSDEAHAFFTVPNYFWGLIGWGVVAATGAGVLAGATYSRWYWRTFAVGMFAAWFFLMWLFVAAVYSIGFLCLYCMITWVTQSIMLWIVTPWLLREKLLFDNDRLARIGATVLPYAWLLPVVNLAVIALAIIAQFPLLVPMLINGY